jgi:cytochrome c oxidase assembly protein subunit 15
MVEFLNRITTTPTLLSALVAMWCCWRLARPEGAPARRDLRLASSITVLGVLLQAGVGAMTVLLELPPEVVSTHFLLSLACIASATIAFHAAGSDRPLRLAGRGGGLRALAGSLMLLSLLAVIVAGVLTTASGPHSGGSGTHHDVDRFGIFGLAVTLHARGAYVFLVLVLVLTWLRANRGVALRDLGILLALVAVQITLGEIQYRNGLPWQVVLAHVANAAAMWLVAVRIAADAALVPFGPTSPETVAARDGDQYDSVSAQARLAPAGER